MIFAGRYLAVVQPVLKSIQIIDYQKPGNPIVLNMTT